jgi:hypothetical protein
MEKYKKSFHQKHSAKTKFRQTFVLPQVAQVELMGSYQANVSGELNPDADGDNLAKIF